MLSDVPVPAEAPSPDSFAVHFLASGSSGNCTLVHDGPEAFLIDFGLPPQAFVEAIRAAGIGIRFWREKKGQEPANQHSRKITAVVLTHTHGDHFCASTLRILRENYVRLWVHAEHVLELQECRAFRKMQEHNLVSCYGGEEFQLTPRVRALPVLVPHDSAATHAFVFERTMEPGRRPLRFGYFADLGYFSPRLVPAVVDCDLLALEFNHDEKLERGSGRHPRTVARVLGNHGHLSNNQAAEAMRQVLANSQVVKPRTIALLHLSNDCNTPELAHSACASMLRKCGVSSDILVTRHRECAGFVDLLAPATPVLREATLEYARPLPVALRKVHVAQDLFD